MRNKFGDKIFASDGNGKIYEGIISTIDNKFLQAEIFKTHVYDMYLSNVTFCIPNLKNPDRLKFALEKCTELGIINFIIYNSSRTIKKSISLERLEKIVLSAMKQSLLSYLPKIEIVDSTVEFSSIKSEKIIFDQLADKELMDFDFENQKKYYLIFGPEGGFTDSEITTMFPSERLNLAKNRLRSETAIVKAASLISSKYIV
jgi:16S rRNA (uracil1498-N3)-methyltransferase